MGRVKRGNKKDEGDNISTKCAEAQEAIAELWAILSTTVKGSSVYVGFTVATGKAADSHSVFWDGALPWVTRPSPPHRLTCNASLHLPNHVVVLVDESNKELIACIYVMRNVNRFYILHLLCNWSIASKREGNTDQTHILLSF